MYILKREANDSYPVGGTTKGSSQTLELMRTFSPSLFQLTDPCGFIKLTKGNS